MRPLRAWKVAAVLTMLAAVAAVSGLAWISHTRPQPLGLAVVSPRSPAPSPDANDPFASVCRSPVVPAGAAGAGLAGVWVIQPGSVVGYRAHEKFADVPSPHEAVARTDRVGGWLLIGDDAAGARIQTGCIAVLLASLRSVDELPGLNTRDRDETVRNFLRAREHPYAVFQPYPSPIAAALSNGATVSAKVSGQLEVNGVGRPAIFALEVRLTETQVAAAGSTTLAVEDYGIDVPQAGGWVAVDPHIILEVSLVLLKP